MVVAIIIFLYLSLFFFDFLPIIKDKKPKEIWIYSIVFIGSFILLFCSAVGVNIPALNHYFSDFLHQFINV